MINRRKAMALMLAGTAASAITRRAHAAEVVLKFANSNALDHPLNVRLKEAVDKIWYRPGERSWCVSFRTASWRRHRCAVAAPLRRNDAVGLASVRWQLYPGCWRGGVGFLGDYGNGPGRR